MYLPRRPPSTCGLRRQTDRRTCKISIRDRSVVLWRYFLSSKEENMRNLRRDCLWKDSHAGGLVMSATVLSVLVFGWLALIVLPVSANHQGHESHVGDDAHETTGSGYAIPG